MGNIIHELQNMTYLNWSQIRNSSGTAGSFLKAYSEIGGRKMYYKISNYDSINGVTGHECVNEIIADRILDVLGIDHLSYTLVNAEILVDGKPLKTYICMSENFRNKNESKIALDAFYDMEKAKNESPLEFCIRNGWEKYIYEMLVFDFLILNRDRHGANIEVLRDRKRKKLRLAPLFDHGLSLLSLCRDPSMYPDYDVMADKPVQCFVGSQSALQNLDLIPDNKRPDISSLKESDKATIMDGLEDIIPSVLYDKIWDMISQRWCYYESVCNKKR